MQVIHSISDHVYPHLDHLHLHLHLHYKTRNTLTGNEMEDDTVAAIITDMEAEEGDPSGEDPAVDTFAEGGDLAVAVAEHEMVVVVDETVVVVEE